MGNQNVLFAALATYKGVALNIPNVEDLREIQRAAREFGEELEFDEIRAAMSEANDIVTEGTKKRWEEKKK